ncbi:MAG: amidase [Promethearchaeota archaeon]
MNKEDIIWMSACDMVDAIKRQDLTSEEVTEVFIERIKTLNPTINAYVTLTFDIAREAAKKADAAVKKGEKLGIIHGIPTSIKDEVETKGIRSTFGSVIFENYIPEEDDVAVARLKDEGMVMLGKTNTPPFGYAPITHNLIFGATKNPWDLTKTPGGSSGGAAAAAAGGLAPLNLGGDGGGSIRIPCSFCGTFGIKPTFGRVPHMFAKLGGTAATLSQGGPLVRYVEDAALFLDVVVGPHHSDKYSVPKPNYSFREKLNETPKKLKIGYSFDLGNIMVIDPEIKKAVLEGAEKLTQMDWKVEESNLINLKDSTKKLLGVRRPKIRSPFLVLGTIWATSFSHILDVTRLLKKYKDKMDPTLVTMCKMGDAFSAKDIKVAELQLEMINENIAEHFKKYDVLITPATPITAVNVDNTLLDMIEIEGRKVSTNDWTAFTYPFNMSGHPAASIPCGWHSNGLPMGMQIVGKRWDEVTVLQVAKAFEKIAPWQDKKPN